MADLTGQGGSPPVITPGGSGATLPTVAIQKTLRVERNSNTTIPAGAMAVEVHNVEQHPSNKIVVNGKDVSYQGKWHFEQVLNCVDNKWELCPEVVIQSNGLEFWFSVTYPAGSAVDINSI